MSATRGHPFATKATWRFELLLSSPSTTPGSTSTALSLRVRGWSGALSSVEEPTDPGPPTRNDPNHHTILLPNPVTPADAKRFNDPLKRGPKE